MTFEEYWDIYVERKQMENADAIIDLFSQPIADNIMEEYDIIEPLLDFLGEHETARSYDKCEILLEKLKQHNIVLYKEVKDFFIKDLVRYYCFVNDVEKLAVIFKKYYGADTDYDFFALSLTHIIYHGYIDIANAAIEHQFIAVKEDDKLLSGAETDMTSRKYAIEFEKFYNIALDTNTNFDYEGFSKKMKPFDFEILEDMLPTLKKCVECDTEHLIGILEDKALEKNQKNIIIVHVFQKFLAKKGIPFVVGDILMDYLFRHFARIVEEKTKFGKKRQIKKHYNTIKLWQEYFKFEGKSFTKFAENQSGFMMDYRINEVLILWGSSYFVDFLEESGIISDEKYIQSQKKIIENAKGKYNEEPIDTFNKADLWHYDFVHSWQPAKGIDMETWTTEQKMFRETYDMVIEEKPWRPEDNDMFGALERLSVLEENEEVKKKEEKRPVDIHVGHYERETRKIGRNEKVDVEYEDGTIKRNVKYKRVMKDVESGKCKLLN